MTKEEALDILRDLHDKSLFSERTALETFVPELKYSKDELIRKSLLDEFTHLQSKGCNKFAGLENENIITWLKKQREHKFEKGDIISDGKIQYRVVGMGKNCVGDDCYSLVRIEIKGVKPFLWICEEADELFEKL